MVIQVRVDPAWLGLALAIALGAWLRLAPVWTATMPIGSGGLFAVMAGELRANHFREPLLTGYNGLGIPFAYPPLGLYLAAILSTLGLPLLTTQQWLPPLLSVLMIPAFWWLARAVVGPGIPATGATIAYALAPYASQLFITGGGLTRAPGLLATILALRALVAVQRTSRPRAALCAGVLAGLALLSHPSVALLLIASGGVLWCCLGHSRWSLLLTAGAGILALGVAAPWWGLVLARYGPAPLVAAATGDNAGQRGSELLDLLHARFTGEPLMPLIAILGLAGLALSITRGCWLLPLWFGLAYGLDVRYGPAYATIPLALAAGVALSALLDTRQHVTRSRAGTAALGTVVVLALVLNAVIWPTTPAADLRPLTSADRQALAWVAAATPPTATFAVLRRGTDTGDALPEWFPALTGRTSVTTVEGAEWLPGHVFAQRTAAAARLNACAERDTRCLTAWLRTADAAVTYVYLAADCCKQITAPPGYQVAYARDGVTILARATPRAPGATTTGRVY